MGGFDVVVRSVLDAVFADARLALPKRVLPFDLDDLAIGVPLADRFAVVVGEDESSIVAAEEVAQEVVAEVRVVDGEVALRVDAAEHLAVAVEVVGRVAVEEVAGVRGDRLLETALPHGERWAGEALHFGDEPLVADFVLIDLGHPAEEAGPVGEVVVEPVVRGEFERVGDGARLRPVLLEALLHLPVALLGRLPLPEAVGERLGSAQLHFPVVRQDVEDVVALHGDAEFPSAGDFDGAAADERGDDAREAAGEIFDDVADGEAFASGVAERESVIPAVLVAACAAEGGEEGVAGSAAVKGGLSAQRLVGEAGLGERGALHHMEFGHPSFALLSLRLGARGILAPRRGTTLHAALRPSPSLYAAPILPSPAGRERGRG